MEQHQLYGVDILLYLFIQKKEKQAGMKFSGHFHPALCGTTISCYVYIISFRNRNVYSVFWKFKFHIVYFCFFLIFDGGGMSHQKFCKKLWIFKLCYICKNMRSFSLNTFCNFKCHKHTGMVGRRLCPSSIVFWYLLTRDNVVISILVLLIINLTASIIT